jgi:hypothetical protein
METVWCGLDELIRDDSITPMEYCVLQHAGQDKAWKMR